MAGGGGIAGATPWGWEAKLRRPRLHEGTPGRAHDSLHPSLQGEGESGPEWQKTLLSLRKCA